MNKDGTILDALSVANDKSTREGRWSTVGEVSKNIDPKFKHEIQFREVYPSLLFHTKKGRAEQRMKEDKKTAYFPPMFRTKRGGAGGAGGKAGKRESDRQGPDTPPRGGKDPRDTGDITNRMVVGILGGSIGGMSGGAPNSVR